MRIGITYTGDDERQLFYDNWIKDNDANIEIIRLHETHPDMALLQSCDGLVLSGGVTDIHPKKYGLDEHYANAPSSFNEMRDDFEWDILGYALHNIPVLGICRGLQLINIFQKGTLIRDLDNLNPVHRAPDSLVADKAHEVLALEGTFLHESIASLEAHVVTSAHHQAIDILGENLLINCVAAEDNLTEGIEWEDKTDKPFMLAVQWHPERMIRIGAQQNPMAKQLRAAFIAACS